MKDSFTERKCVLKMGGAQKAGTVMTTKNTTIVTKTTKDPCRRSHNHALGIIIARTIIVAIRVRCMAEKLRVDIDVSQEMTGASIAHQPVLTNATASAQAVVLSMDTIGGDVIATVNGIEVTITAIVTEATGDGISRDLMKDGMRTIHRTNIPRITRRHTIVATTNVDENMT